MKHEGRKEISPALLSFVATLEVRGQPMEGDPRTNDQRCRNVVSSGESVNSVSSSATSEKSITPLGRTTDIAPSNGERLQRSRERNRIHARKTRQRKKEQMQTLTNRADELKSEQIRLKQCINEKNTASILVGLFASDTATGDHQHTEDPRIEALLRRSCDDIPDAQMLPELPALILPGQHNAKKLKSSAPQSQKVLSDDGIDYDLLGKDRSKCSAAELDKIRRERNRMHAKRTRDRKRFFMEEMAEMCQKLEDENVLLQSHLDSLNGKEPSDGATSVISPSLSSTTSVPISQPTPLSFKSKHAVSPHSSNQDQISTLLEVASAFSSAISDSSSRTSSEGNQDSDGNQKKQHKRRRLEQYAAEIAHHSVPTAITASAATAVGC